MTIPCSATYFLEVCARVSSLKAATKGCLRVKKKSEKVDFEVVFRKQKGSSAKSGMLLPGTDTCFLEVSPHVSLKLATKGYFRGKKTLEISRKFTYLGSSSKGKTEECHQRN